MPYWYFPLFYFGEVLVTGGRSHGFFYVNIRPKKPGEPSPWSSIILQNCTVADYIHLIEKHSGSN